MKNAWVENNKIRDIVTSNPYDVFHKDIAKLYSTEVADYVRIGATFIDGEWVNPIKPEPVEPEPVVVEPVYEKVTPIEFKLLFTSPERVVIKAARSTDPIVDDFFDLVEDPRLSAVDLGLKSTQDALDYLTAQGLLVEGRKAQILANEPQ
jgi:hypothetical protein